MGLYNRERVIQEVYFGNSSELTNLQKQFSLFRSKYINNTVFNKKINTDPELLKFNRMTEDFFGFKSFALIIEPELELNACTYPISYRLDTGLGKKYLESTKTGFKFKKEAGYSCLVYMNSSFIVDSRFSDREVFAIILHEIGHNFQATLNPTCTGFSIIAKFVNILTLIKDIIVALILPFGYAGGKSVVGDFNALTDLTIQTTTKLKKEQPATVEMFYGIKNIIGVGKGVFMNALIALSAIGVITNPIVSIATAIYNRLASIALQPEQLIYSFFGYQGEKVSDNFASIYGYGPDISSAMLKFRPLGAGYSMLEAINETPLLGHLYNLFTLPVDIIFSLFDPHPADAARANGQLKYLEVELKKSDIDPKIKKQIQEDIDSINKLIDEFTDIDMEDPYVFKRIYAAVLLKLCGGDIRELFGSQNNKNFDKAVERSDKQKRLNDVKIK
ncbi:MAG: hypothetical protein M0P49_00990 [Bacilli bacterium]|nr:hypothetical protein [Bacilli bacterium]